MQNKENKRLLARSVREGTDRTHSERSTFAEEWKKNLSVQNKPPKKGRSA